MKFVWEEKDIKVGRRYSRGEINEVWMIGYQPMGEREKRYSSVSLSDGLITTPKTAAETAQMLTDEKYVPLEFLPPKKT